MATPQDLPMVADLEHHVVDIDGLRIHYAVAGEGEPLILLHGWPQHWWSWRHVIGPLSEHYRVICPDLRGMGWSDGSQRGYSLERMARDVVDLMDELGVDRARLIGHDWGLAIGYRTCLNWPDRILQFVALAGVHPWTLDGAPFRLWRAPWHIYLISLLGNTATTRLGVTERCLRAWRHAGEFTPEEAEIFMRQMRRPVSDDATIRYDRNLLRRELPFFINHYRALRQRVQTLHLNGEYDPLTIGVPDSYRDYADDMRLELVPDCGHFIAEERPEWLVERLKRFLN
ncbi:alpha/beta hydrolase [Kribbella sancticallisti]|uniref:Alpha/beta hydrolase n=2 Tax=Kribbella sancticallisti TaxID=460087 RepID=A0ABN2CNK1_9ACTN